MRKHPLALCVLLPVSLGAQTYFSPAAAATGTGNVNNTLPFAQQTQHYQQVHSTTSFSSGAVGIITRLRFRSKAATTGGTADMEMFMARCPNAAENASATFASNETTGTVVNVVTRKQVNLQAVGAGVWGAPDLLFDNPFAFVPSLHLSWRVAIHSNTATSNTLDCYSDWRFGTKTVYNGCQHPLGTGPAQHNSTFRSPGNVWDLNGYSYLANVPLPGAVMIGDSNALWGSIPLPYDLGAVGAPGCQIVNNPAVVLSGTTLSNPTGFLGIQIGTPRNPNLVGLAIYTQFLFVDPAANQLGVFTSNGRANYPIPAPVEVTRIYASSPTATAGTLGPDFALPIGLN